MAKKQIHKIVHRKLGREKAQGLAWKEDNVLEVDERIYGYSYLLVMLHEHFHLKHPEWSETMVTKQSSKTARFLWELGFRWCDLGKRGRF
jgi:hypothetical protein